MEKPGMPIWVCACCMLTHANDECCADHAQDPSERVTVSNRFSGVPMEPTPMPWALWDDHERRRDMSMGMLSSEHDPECAFNRSEGAADCESECETRSFTWESCDGCGSHLGGERYAFTPWFTDPD
jgi:hypothetical protein